MMRRSRGHITVSLLAASIMSASADAAIPRETGGILLGWCIRSGIHVSAAIEVPDPSSGFASYSRDHSAAAALLRGALADEPTDSPVGYVGEWHSHPAPSRPSHTDRKAMRRLALDAKGTVALVVLARAAPWSHHGALYRRWTENLAEVQIEGSNR